MLSLAFANDSGSGTIGSSGFGKSFIPACNFFCHSIILPLENLMKFWINCLYFYLEGFHSLLFLLQILKLLPLILGLFMRGKKVKEYFRQ